MTTRDYRVIRRRGANGCDQFSLDAVPAITVFDHRLINHFEKYRLRISLRQMRCKSTPELRERFNAALISIHSEFELVTRMNIDNDGQTRAQNHVERAVNVLKIGAVEYRRIGRVAHQWRWFNRKAHVIKTHGLD